MRANKLSKLVGYGTFLLLAVATGLGTVELGSKPAAASTFGTTYTLGNPGSTTGYYSGTAYNPDHRRFFYQDGIPMDWPTNPYGTTAQTFIDQVSNYLNNTGPNAVFHQQEYDAARASIMINTMMGVQSQDPRYDLNPALARWQNGVILAKQLFPTWAQIVKDYANPAGNIYGGSVDFNYHIFNTGAEVNGAGIGDANLPVTGDFLGSPKGTAHGDFPDAVFYPLGQPEDGPAIRFTHANGTTFTIKKWCGNLIGDESPFPLDWQHKPSITGTTPTGTIYGNGGMTLQFVSDAKNVGRTPSTGGILAAMVQVDGQTPQVVKQEEFGPVNAGGNVGPMPFSYPIQPFTAAGTQFCFYTAVNPTTIAIGESDSQKLCYNVGYSSSPAVQGLNGDVQAGGGICGQALSGGNVKGNSNAVSMGDYVVAAAGLISNFKSNGTGGSNNLSLGSYARTCRPDLMAATMVGRTASAAVIPGGTATVDLGTLTGPGKPDVYYFNGQTLNISGTVHAKVTIVATAGSVHIVGPVLLDSTPAAVRYVPSFGLIAQGDIVIEPLVTRVDAYLFSNGTIDTCDPGAFPGSTACTSPQLVVNGFLMAKNILFNRVGRANTSGAQISEKIILTPQLYLNPPRFFDDASQQLLQAQGEQPPLF